MLEYVTERVSVWDSLREMKRPVVLYGTGNGAIKILEACRLYDIPVSGIFASDEYVRGQSFQGFEVQHLSDLEQTMEDFVVLLAFGVNYDSMLESVHRLSTRHLVLAPDLPVVGEGLFTWDYVCQHANELDETYQRLADEESRRVFAAMLNFKISGKLEYLFATMGSRKQDFEDLLCLGAREIYLDLGAYDGDTVLEFLEQVQDYHSIIAVEPNPKNYRKLLRTVKEHGIERITCHNLGVYSRPTSLFFSERAGRNCACCTREGVQVAVNTVDNLLDGAPVTYIKMDVEGMERETLLGCTQTIALHRPVLSVAVYHRNEDLIVLPKLLEELESNYRLYLRRHKYIPAWEILLYGIPAEKSPCALGEIKDNCK